MADEQVIDNQPTEAAAPATEGNPLDVVSENVTYAVTKSAAGVKGFAEYKEGNSTFIAVNGGKNPDGSDKEPTLELLHKIDVSIPYVHSVAGISQLVTDEEEAVSIFNKGLAQKVTTKLRSYFTEEENGVLVHLDETTFDATEFASEPMKRRAMSDSAKLVKVLKGASQEDVLAALRAMGIIA